MDKQLVVNPLHYTAKIKIILHLPNKVFLVKIKEIKKDLFLNVVNIYLKEQMICKKLNKS
jgi:hypothetical protein